MTQEQKTKISEHFDELHAIVSDYGLNVPNDIRDALRVAYLAGADYALDIYCPHWISVEDELPKGESEYDEFSEIVLATDGKDVYESRYHIDYNTWYTRDMFVFDDVTHWMPLPSVEHLKEKE